MDVSSFIGNRTLEKKILSSGCIDSQLRVRKSVAWFFVGLVLMFEINLFYRNVLGFV